MKYELLLSDIYKHTKRAGLVQDIPILEEAISVMKVSNFHYSCHIIFPFFFLHHTRADFANVSCVFNFLIFLSSATAIRYSI